MAVPGLALLGAAVGRTRAAAVKPGYSEPPAVWAVVVAPPGSTKSAALKAASGPLWAAEGRWRDRHQGAMAAFDAADAQYAQAAKAWQAGGCQGEPPAKPRKPALRQALLDGFTGEALVRGLAANPRGLVVSKDELSGLVGALNAYRGGRGDDRERLLSCWAGAAVKANRVSDADAPPLLVPHPFLAVCGMICPDALPALRGEKAGADAPADGFADRFLMSFPDALPAAAESWRTVPDDLADGYCEVVLDLLGLDFVTGEDGEPRPYFIRFDDGARGVWEGFTATIAALVNGCDAADPFRGVLSKLRGYAARLACVLWCVGRACGGVAPDAPIDARVLSAAVDLVDYFSAHARRCLGRGVTDRAGRVSRRLVSWLEARPGLAAFTRSEAFQQLKDRRDVTRGADLDAPLTLLIDHGFIRLVAGEVGARPGPVPQTFAVNPHWERVAQNSGDFGDGNNTGSEPNDNH